MPERSVQRGRMVRMMRRIKAQTRKPVQRCLKSERSGTTGVEDGGEGFMRIRLETGLQRQTNIEHPTPNVEWADGKCGVRSAECGVRRPTAPHPGPLPIGWERGRKKHTAGVLPHVLGETQSVVRVAWCGGAKEHPIPRSRDADAPNAESKTNGKQVRSNTDRHGRANSGGAVCGGRLELSGHQEPFLRQARTRSSTVALGPREFWAARTDSWASICLKPRAMRARTASLTFWSASERAR